MILLNSSNANSQGKKACNGTRPASGTSLETSLRQRAAVKTLLQFLYPDVAHSEILTNPPVVPTTQMYSGEGSVDDREHNKSLPTETLKKVSDPGAQQRDCSESAERTEIQLQLKLRSLSTSNQRLKEENRSLKQHIGRLYQTFEMSQELSFNQSNGRHSPSLKSLGSLEEEKGESGDDDVSETVYDVSLSESISDSSSVDSFFWVESTDARQLSQTGVSAEEGR